MNRLIEDILKLSRITRSGFHRETVSLSELAKSQATRLSSANAEREIHWEIAENMLVKGDSLLLNLLLEHLLENAIRFSRNTARTEVCVGVDSTQDSVVYFVKDNGCGFDMRYSDRLFTAFQRLHSEEFSSGTGVGLAMVQRIVQRHGGRVWAESELGVGSVFYFTLPE
jgi:light-regulated signal transduction histidine kinase (bacteriophytochrome)